MMANPMESRDAANARELKNFMDFFASLSVEPKLHSCGYTGTQVLSALRFFAAQAGTKECAVALIGAETSDGIIAYAFGGTHVHVGGCAVAGEAICIDSQDAVYFARAGHQDHILAQQIAQELSLALRQPAFVSAGFHIDAITSEQIACVLENGRAAARKAIERLV